VRPIALWVPLECHDVASDSRVSDVRHANMQSGPILLQCQRYYFSLFGNAEIKPQEADTSGALAAPWQEREEGHLLLEHKADISTVSKLGTGNDVSEVLQQWWAASPQWPQ
jgi:hypothetical protein